MLIHLKGAIMSIKPNMTIKEIVDKYPKTLNVFISNGFAQFKDKGKLNTMGKILKLESALKTKEYNLITYIKLLEDTINEENVDITLQEQLNKGNISVMGLLPCPVRLPLLESFDKKVKELKEKYGVKTGYKLEAASVGASWIEENFNGETTVSDLPEIFVSAGFEAFFDKKSIGKFKEQKIFEDLTGSRINKDFENIGLKDPKGDYSIISVVPAVFMINLNEIGDRKLPEKWSDLLKPEFEGRVSLPVGDFDLFNSLLLNFYKEFGEEGIEKLGKAMHSSMHPSQMVKNGNSKTKKNPIITILPYFFTRMAKASSLKIVWPKDGAMVSPIFMLIKKPVSEPVKEIADFFFSKKVGEILSHRGLFPSLNPEVNNNLPENSKFKWIGWDYIYSNDIGELIRKTNDIFNKNMEEVIV
jgi:ABC-type Fe3+ transport system substrate-binding protein